MPRDFEAYLDDILQAIEEITAFTASISTIAEFQKDTRTRRAVERNLEIIGEAVKKVPEDIRFTQSEIQWAKIAGLRDILAHAYFVIDSEILWDVIQTKLVALAEAVAAIKKRVQSS